MTELRHLRYFVAVAEERHFTRAAERLGMAQPPLSQQIRALERELGVLLFRRTNRRVELTDAGRVLLEGARRTLSSAEQAIRDAQRAARGEVGRLSLAFVGSAMAEALPAILSGYRLRNPNVELALYQRTTAEQIEMLRAGSVQVGVVRPPVADDTLELEIIVREAMLAALPERHTHAGRRSIRLRELADDSFILFPRQFGPGLHDRLILACHAEGFAPRISQEAAEMQTIVGLVGAGLGVSLVPASVRRLRSDGVRYVLLEDDVPPWDLALARRRDDDSPLVRGFVSVARETIQRAGDGAV